MEIKIKDIEEMRELAKRVGAALSNCDNLLLWGDLGAGKTTFVKAMADTLEIDDYITSPTFNLHNNYQGRLSVDHFDLYRLEDPEEAIELGLDNYFYGDGLTIVEWPERGQDFLPDDRIDLYIEHGDGQERTVKIDGQGEGYERLIKELRE